MSKAVTAKTLTALLALAVLITLGGMARAGDGKIGALGRISPKGGITDLMGPMGDSVAQVLVQPGAVVKKDEPLALFASRDLRQMELDLAELAEREAVESEAGINQSQQHKVQVARAEHELAAYRYHNLENVGGASLSAQQMAQRKTQMTVTQIKLTAALADLERLKLENAIRVNRAREQVRLAREKLAQSTLRAPGDGTILEVHKTPGEAVGGQPLVSMADLSKLYVVAEIFEGDVLRLKPGQAATITSNALPNELKGRVETIGRIITPQSKIARVWILLDQTEPAARLLNAEVNVSIVTDK